MVDVFDVIKPVFLSTFGSGLVYSAVPNLIVQKVCSPHPPSNIDDFICHQNELVSLATEIVTTRNIVRSVSSGLSLGLFGVWRDVSGRSSPLLYIGVAAEMVGAVSYIFASLNWASSAWIWAMVEAGVSGLFGQNVLHLGANCLAISNTTTNERISKLQLYLLSIAFGTILADSVAGFLLTSVGFQWFFFIPVALQAVAIIFTFLVHEPPSPGSSTTVAETVRHLCGLFKMRPNIAVIWLMIICNALVITYLSAENSVVVYFMQQAFGFTVKQSTMFITYHTVICVIGGIAIPNKLRKFFNWNSFKIGISSSLLTTVSSSALAFVNEVHELYLVSLLDVMKYVLYAVPQFILSMCVKNEELGLFLGLGSIVCIGLPFVVNYLYNYTFSRTHETWPGAIYFLSAGVNLVIAISLSVGYYIYSPGKPASRKNSSSDVDDATITANYINDVS